MILQHSCDFRGGDNITVFFNIAKIRVCVLLPLYGGRYNFNMLGVSFNCKSSMRVACIFCCKTRAGDTAATMLIFYDAELILLFKVCLICFTISHPHCTPRHHFIVAI